MKITILTPSYNQGEFIEETILSVQHQQNCEIEHIVIDGGSKDNTVSILKKYPHLTWISEKDEGQSDALQKGLQMSTGEIIGWINSDDYLEENILCTIEKYFLDNKVDWVIGNLIFFDQKSQKKSIDKSILINRKNLLSNPDILRQPPTFFRKSSLIKAGGFQKKYHLTMDLDLWFRMLKLSNPLMIDKNLAFFRTHADQKTSGKQTIAQLREMLDIFKKNNASLYFIARITIRKLFFTLKIRLVYFLRKLNVI